MSEAIDTEIDEVVAPAPSRGCARCGGRVPVRTRYFQIAGSSVRVYCSQDCLQSTGPIPTQPGLAPERRRLGFGELLVRFGLAAAAGCLTSGPLPDVPIATRASVTLPAPAMVVPEPAAFGPSWPPSENDWSQVIGSDAWIHPLDGPVRRMPIRDARVFGAERPGDRPAECRSGHCGVDIGGEVWGEPVHAVHEGVVDRVQRGPNEEHGGQYVRIAHRDGTIFTQYFHLAAIPKRLEPGIKVKVGEVIGLLGDTGVKHSTAHLHFTVSVKPSKELPEQYIDPEPLIALWPLRLPVANGTAGMVTASAAPGVPLGAHRRPKRHAATGDAVAAQADGEATASE